MSTITPDWTSLPKDLIILIAKCLRSRFDLLRFRAVCSSFRAVVPLPPKVLSPHRLSRFRSPFAPKCNHLSHFVLGESTIYAIQPLNKISNVLGTTKTWLVRLEESNPGRYLVLDPLGDCFPFENLSGKLPMTLNLLDYQVEEVSKVYELGVDVEEAESCTEFDRTDLVHFRKVVVSKCLDEIDDGYVLMALVSGGRVCVKRTENEKWTIIDPGLDNFLFEDIVYHKEKFYAMGSLGVTVTLHSISLESNLVATPLQMDGILKYLVKSSDDLYLVAKHYLDVKCEESCFEENSNDEYHPIRWNVFKLDEENRQWVQVMNDLMDRVLFVGDHCSFSISAKDFPGCKRNCVYFTEGEFCKDKADYPGSDAGVYDLEDDIAGPLSAFPGYSKIFWPPPTWLKQNPSSIGW